MDPFSLPVTRPMVSARPDLRHVNRATNSHECHV